MHRILLAAMVLGLSAVAVTFTTWENNDSAEALHAMPCPDLDADGVVTPGDFALIGTYPLGMPVPPAPPAVDMIPDGIVTPADVGFVFGAIGAVGLICQDTPVGPGPTAGPAADFDGDGCTAIEEAGPAPGLGGLRDDYNHWDLYDVTGEGAVAAGDIFGVLGRFGSGDPTPGKTDPPGTVAPPAPAYHSSFDRGPAVAPFFPVDLGPPSGAITTFDIFAAIGQFGNTCVPPP